MRLAIKLFRVTFLTFALAVLFAVGVGVQCVRSARVWVGRATILARARLYQGFEGEGCRRW